MTETVIAMVAGEASGDFLGAHLIAGLRSRLPNLRFVGIGGPRMESEGFESWYPMEQLAVRGYAEVLRHYLPIVAMRRSLQNRLLKLRPAMFIGVDAPDFNLPLERRLKSRGMTTVHYVSPSLWAWRGGRIKSIAKSVSQMLVLFPFEEPIYRNAGIPVAYVGHPLADVIPLQIDTGEVRAQLKLPPARKVIALLPGSRQSELRYLASTFVKTAGLIAKRNPAVHFLVPLVSRETRSIFETALYAEGLEGLPLTILFGHAREALAAADAVLVASGTATLETALCGRPMVIAYKMSDLTWRLMSRMKYLPWVGLPNVIAGEYIVPELLQDDATPENLAQAVLNWLNDGATAEKLVERLSRIHLSLRRNTAEAATEALMPWLVRG
jgi:lipid-A-disaccharide synthase